MTNQHDVEPLQKIVMAKVVAEEQFRQLLIPFTNTTLFDAIAVQTIIATSRMSEGTLSCK